MATSGVYVLNKTALQMIQDAFELCGQNAAEQPLQPFEIQNGLTALNSFIKTCQAYNSHLWATDEGVLFLNNAQPSFELGATGDNACFDNDFIPTQTTADTISGATVLLVESSLGMLAGDYVGVQINNNLRQWTTIASVNSLTQITLASPLLASTVSGNSVFTYTTKVVRPLRVLDARRKTYAQPDEIALTFFSRQQYFAQVNKNQEGTPISCYYSPELGNGIFYIWQPTSSVNQYIRFTFYRPLQKVTNVTQTLDFPEEWEEGIVWNIASRLSTKYSIPADKKAEIKQQAQEFFENVIQFDEEMTSLNILPDFSRYS
jgi:hypothetical protein